MRYNYKSRVLHVPFDTQKTITVVSDISSGQKPAKISFNAIKMVLVKFHSLNWLFIVVSSWLISLKRNPIAINVLKH